MNRYLFFLIKKPWNYLPHKLWLFSSKYLTLVATVRKFPLVFKRLTRKGGAMRHSKAFKSLMSVILLRFTDSLSYFVEFIYFITAQIIFPCCTSIILYKVNSSFGRLFVRAVLSLNVLEQLCITSRARGGRVIHPFSFVRYRLDVVPIDCVSVYSYLFWCGMRIFHKNILDKWLSNMY